MPSISDKLKLLENRNSASPLSLKRQCFELLYIKEILIVDYTE